MDATVKIDHTLLAVESEHTVHAMLELDAPAALGDGRAPLHVALVVDRSGSMSGDKLAAARAAARFLCERLRPTDELALVSFDDEVQLLAALGPAEPDRLVPAIDSIWPGGTTNLSGGWLKGLEELRRAQGDGVRRIVLLTDGLANVGVTDPARIVKFVEQARIVGGTSTVGFGAGFDEDLLAAMADAGGGSTYFAETPEDAPGIFAKEFEGLASVVAQNVSVEIRVDDRVQLLGVLNEYPVVEVPGGLQVQLGDAYGGERRRVVCKLQVPNLAALGPCRLAELVIRYVSVGDEVAAHEVTVPLVVNLVSADDAAKADIDSEVTDEVLLLEAARARREARDLADREDFGAASAVLHSSIAGLRSAAVSSPRAADFAIEIEELTAHGVAMDSRSYDPNVRKRMSQQSWQRRRGRS